MQPNRASQSKKYDVAFSFADEDRQFVQDVATHLTERGVEVFYDDREKAKLWGEHLPEELARIYREDSRYVVVFVSEHYAAKAWTRHELRSALETAITSQSAYILPARFDNTCLPGLNSTIAYIDLKTESPDSFAEVIIAKLNLEPTIDRVRPQRAFSRRKAAAVSVACASIVLYEAYQFLSNNNAIQSDGKKRLRVLSERLNDALSNARSSRDDTMTYAEQLINEIDIGLKTTDVENEHDRDERMSKIANKLLIAQSVLAKVASNKTMIPPNKEVLLEGKRTLLDECLSDWQLESEKMQSEGVDSMELYEQQLLVFDRMWAVYLKHIEKYGEEIIQAKKEWQDFMDSVDTALATAGEFCTDDNYDYNIVLESFESFTRTSIARRKSIDECPGMIDRLNEVRAACDALHKERSLSQLQGSRSIK